MSGQYADDPIYQLAVSEGSRAIIEAWGKVPKKFRGGLILGKLVIGALMQIRGQQSEWFNGLSVDKQQSLADDLIYSAKALIYRPVSQ